MIVLWTCLTALLVLIAYLLSRDLACPAVVSGVIWLAVYLLLLAGARDVAEQHDTSYFFVAYLFFALCFFLPLATTKLGRPLIAKPLSAPIEWEPSFEKMTIAIEYILTAVFLVASYSDARASGRSLWQGFRYALYESEFLSSWWVGLLRSGIAVLFLLAVCLSLANPTARNKSVFLRMLPPVIVSMLFSSRGDWFLLVIGSAFMYIIIRCPATKRVAVMGLTGIVLTLVIFFVSSFDKFSNAWTWESNSEKALRYAMGYFVMPPVGFLQFVDSGFANAGGAYTFRFSFALLRPLIPSIEVVPTVQEFFTYGSYSSNVYTALHWYTIDFGFWWACAVEGALGLLYGWLYKRVRHAERVSAYTLVVLSLLMFPICNQFFDEKIFSVLSLWLQRFLILYLILHSPLIRHDTQLARDDLEPR